MKTLLVVLDGLSDWPVRELGNKTPLEAAEKSFIDRLASLGAQGYMDPISPGTIPGSDTSHLAIFGIDPRKYYPGRGPFEAIGSGAILNPGDVAFRGNFATVNEDMVVTNRRAGRIDFGLDQLVRDLNSELNKMDFDGVRIELYRGAEHRVAVVLRGHDLSYRVSDTDPHKEGLKVLSSRPLDNDPRSIKTADIINKFTSWVHKFLTDHKVNRDRVEHGYLPANIILVRGAGMMRKIPRITEHERLNITRPAAISATSLIKGVCRLVGFEVYHPEGATGGLNTRIDVKVDTAIKLLKGNYDLVFLHFKGTDSASHDGKPDAKKRFIEKVSSELSRIFDEFNGEIVIGITGDHTTSSIRREHASDPVPFLVYAPRMFRDSLSTFSERTSRQGGMGRIRGVDLLYLLMDLAEKQDKFGA